MMTCILETGNLLNSNTGKEQQINHQTSNLFDIIIVDEAHNLF